MGFSINRTLEPLAIATNILQSDSTRLDTVLLTLGKLHYIFSDEKVFSDAAVRERVTGSLERRWKAAHQEVFIIAVFLNPYLRAGCFNPSNQALTYQGLWNMYRELYTQMMQMEPDIDIVRAFDEYYNWQGLFSEKAMYLREMQGFAMNKVCDVINFTSVNNVLILFQMFDIDLVLLWRRTNCGPHMTSVNAFASFAARILSIVPNSAATERIFSKFGVIHSKHRNRLRPEKVRYITIIKDDINKRWPLRPGSNRYGISQCEDSDNELENDAGSMFETPSLTVSLSEPGTSSSNDPDNDPISFADVASRLSQDLDANSFDATSDPAPHLRTASSSRMGYIPYSEGLYLTNIFDIRPDSQGLFSTSTAQIWHAAQETFNSD